MTTGSRRLTASDGMTLVAAAAAGFALLRVTLPGFWPSHGYSWPGAGASARAYLDAAARQAIGAGPPVALGLTLGYFAVRLRGPRPPWRRLARQPGTAACLATLPAVAMLTAAYLVVNALPGRSLELWYALVLLTYPAGPAVLGVWFTQGVAGRLRAPRDAVEAMGVAIGAGWVTLALGALYSLRR